MINEITMNKSLDVAQEVLDISDNLSSAGALAEYFDRDDYLQGLVKEEGYMTFVPTVTTEITEPFKAVMGNDVELIRNAYFRYSRRDSGVECFRAYLASNLYESITSEDMVNNQVPVNTVNFIATYLDNHRGWDINDLVKKEVNSYKSPKLSKLLVKLFGEQSETVKYYTCKCPKSLTRGALDEWRVTLSVLPHHIAGMSYYAPLNHGGSRWKEGYEGTSCVDTKRNGSGNGVFQLVPSLKDTTMAVAYLSKSTDNDIWNPIYEARCLVRVMPINGDAHLIVCRPYFTDNETKHILLDGLKNKFNNVHTAIDMRDYTNGITLYEEIEVRFPDHINYSVDAEIVCKHCDGRGDHGVDEDGDRDICSRCDGDGNWRVNDSFLPYIDDGEFIHVYDNKMRFTIPTEYLKAKGIIVEDVEPEAEVEEVADTFSLRPLGVEEEADPFFMGELVAEIGDDLPQPVAYMRAYEQAAEVELEDVQINGNAMRELLGIYNPRQHVRIVPEDFRWNVIREVNGVAD